MTDHCLPNRPATLLFVLLPAWAAMVAGCASTPQSKRLEAREDRRFACASGAAFAVENSGTVAVVRFDDGSYRLQRRPSSIGEKFASPQATLIIDGDFAAFVAEDRLDVDGCTAAAHVAEAPTLRN